MAALLASGTTAASSADFTLTGETSTLFLDSAAAQVPADAIVLVELKAASGVYHIVGKMSMEIPAVVLSGPGTYRVSRQLCAVAVGVDRV